MVILVIRRLAWGITNRGSRINKYIFIYMYVLYYYIFIKHLPSYTKFTKFTIY